MLKKVNQGHKVLSKLNQKMKIWNVDLTTSLASRNGEFVAEKVRSLSYKCPRFVEWYENKSFASSKQLP